MQSKVDLIYRLLILLICCQLAACFDTPLENEWAEYPNRVHNLVTKITDTAKNRPPYSLNDNQLDFESTAIQQPESLTIPFTQALSINACNMQQYIGERNSSLGKVHSHDSRLVYELRFLRELLNCRDIEYPASQTQQQILQEIKKHKQQQWPNQLSYFLAHSKQSNAILRRHAKLLEHDNIGFAASKNYLQALFEISKTQPQAITDANIEKFERSIAQFKQNKFIARLFYTLELTQYQLTTAAESINELTNLKPCKKTHKPLEVVYLNNVLIKYYGQVLQPHLTYLQRVYKELVPLIESIWQAPAIQQQAFAARYLTTAAGSVYQDFENAVNSHTKSWQKLLAQCQMSPSVQN
ncbi:DUF3080 family protein [Catenovulum sediminis]|uniref:DUF3080 family protein n=1 Tax=Catenovulum sediminis TaxID=1740262 RepID=UPI001181339D|nr:DUF3080 family protein [Catenovulum sediminis]